MKWISFYTYTALWSKYFSVAPVVNLRIGKSLKENEVKEGDDVYFECEVSANPAATEISWTKDVNLVSGNKTIYLLLF